VEEDVDVVGKEGGRGLTDFETCQGGEVREKTGESGKGEERKEEKRERRESSAASERGIGREASGSYSRETLKT